MGRKPNQRRRLGHLETRRLRLVIRRIREFPITSADATKSETDLNKALNAWMLALEPGWTTQLHQKVPFGGTNFNPDGTLPAKNSRLPLVAYEGKKLVDSNPQKAWKEGIGQAFTYRVLFKVALLVLYDFTTGAAYSRALGPGNAVESSFAAKIRRKWRIHVIVLKPKMSPAPA